MHLLILTTHAISSPRFGGDLRVAKLINQFIRLGGTVSVIRFCDSKSIASKSSGSEDKNLTITNVRLPPGYAIPPVAFLTHVLAIKAGTVALRINRRNRIDLVQSDPLSVAISGMIIAKTLGIPHVILSQNCESTLAARISVSSPTRHIPLIGRLIVSINLSVVRWVEKLVIARSQLILTPSMGDRNDMASVGIDVKRVELLPNGTDLRPQPRSTCLSVRKSLGLDVRTRAVIFAGRLDYPPNREAVFLINQSIAPRCPQLIFLVAGLNPPKIKYGENIRVLGYVERVEDYLSASDLVIVPLTYGSGTRIKILDAWATHKPVLATSAAADGLVYEKNRNIIIEDDIQRFPKQITKLLDSPKLLSILRSGAAEASKEYSWDVIGQSYWERIMDLLDIDRTRFSGHL